MLPWTERAAVREREALTGRGHPQTASVALQTRSTAAAAAPTSFSAAVAWQFRLWPYQGSAVSRARPTRQSTPLMCQRTQHRAHLAVRDAIGPLRSLSDLPPATPSFFDSDPSCTTSETPTDIASERDVRTTDGRSRCLSFARTSPSRYREEDGGKTSDEKSNCQLDTCRSDASTRPAPGVCDHRL